MSEKLKPNFTPIPNIILDEMMRRLAPGATKVLFAICRFTYGWGKQADRISLTQLQEITGMARGSVARSIKDLGDIVSVTPGDPSRNQASEYRLNVEISDRDLVALRDQPLVSKRDQASLLASLIKRPSKDNQRNKNSANAPSVSSPPRKRKKLTRPDPAAVQAFESFYRAYPKHVGRKPALAAWLKLNPDPALTETVVGAVRRYAEQTKESDPRFILHPATWLNQERWTDETVSANGAGNGRAEGPPKIVKREGDMLTLADGSITPAGTYQRKYGISP